MIEALFGTDLPVIAVVHVPPLPGAFRATRGFDEVLATVLQDAESLARGGADALLVENYGDAPFARSRVRPHVGAFLAIAAGEIRRRFGLPVGVNCLRNDAETALGAAAAAGAQFIRVNVLVGVTATDQGLIEGCAEALARYRRELGASVLVLADVDVKHGTPLFVPPVESLAATAVERGGADAVIVTGPATGSAPDVEMLARIKASAGTVPVIAGSGATPGNVAALLAVSDGVIVGSALEEGGRAGNRVDPSRVRAFVEAVRAVRSARRRPDAPRRHDPS